MFMKEFCLIYIFIVQIKRSSAFNPFSANVISGRGDVGQITFVYVYITKITLRV